MKIQIISDLHLEFQSNRDWLRNNPLVPRGEVLLIAGDTVCDKYKKKAEFFFKKISKDFSMVLSTMGNHEFYHGLIDYAYPHYHKWIGNNHLQANNYSYEYENVKFIISVLWSFIPLYREAAVEQGLNDYCYIRTKKGIDKTGIIRVSETNNLHQLSVNYIQQELNKPYNGKFVILTHHLPSYDCIDKNFRGSPLDAAYASNLHKIMEDNSNIAYWICGHSHDRHITKINNTIVVRNPLGYVDYNEQSDFKRDLVIEI